MKWTKTLPAALLLASFAMPAQAQFFARKPRPQNLGVPELIVMAKSDSDEHKRLMAVEQLREHDAKANADVVPALIDVMLNDLKSSVRMEALHSLTRIRPSSPLIGQALQQAAQHDENIRIRWQARSSMWMHGSFLGKDNNGAPQTTSKEPPLLNSGTVIVSPLVPVPSTPQNPPSAVPPMGTPAYVPSYPENRALPPGNTVSLPRPLPSGPTGFSTALPPRPMPAAPVAPTPPPSDDGPMIIPAP